MGDSSGGDTSANTLKANKNEDSSVDIRKIRRNTSSSDPESATSVAATTSA